MKTFFFFKTSTVHILVIALILGLGFLSSCKKEEEVSVKTPTEYLTAHRWKLETPTEECDKDDLWAFKSNKDLVYSVGVNKCYVDEQDEQGTWALDETGKKLTLFNGSIGFTFDIKQLDDEHLTIAITIDDEEDLTHFIKE